MIALIAAMAKNRVIGRDGRMPWHIPGEQKRFRELTMGNVVIMGRRNYMAIGRPFPGRENVILSRSPDFSAPGCRVLSSLEKALDLYPYRDIYIAGGSILYREALPLARVIFLTELVEEVPGDAFFPEFPESEFRRTEGPLIEASIPYRYVVYSRR